MVRYLSLAGLVLLLFLGGLGWFYLYGPNRVSAAELVPSDTLFFATIPNGTAVATGYELSNLRKVMDSPPMHDALTRAEASVGGDNVELLRDFLPCLSGQSFVAVTKFDPLRPGEAWIIAGFKPKLGFDRFDDWTKKLRTRFPSEFGADLVATKEVEGQSAQVLTARAGSGRLLVARVEGWTVTASSEAALGDWLQRYHRRGHSPSLAQSAAYLGSIRRIGEGNQAIAYLNGSALVQLYSSWPGRDHDLVELLRKTYAGLGGIISGTQFSGGELVDRLSVLFPESARLAAGLVSPGASAFETLKFTGPDTRFYVDSAIDWPSTWTQQMEVGQQLHHPNPRLEALQGWAADNRVDLKRNLIEALGKEVAIQVDWSDSNLFPEAVLWAKINQPEAFQPFFAALGAWIERTAALNHSGSVSRENLNGTEMVTLQLAQGYLSPTITNDGHFFGLFALKTQAVRCLQPTGPTLADNAEFKRQLGAKKAGASSIIFLDTPQVLDHSYKLAQGYVALAGALLPQGVKLPPDVKWLHPMGSWATLSTIDADGVQTISQSGIGNQGILLSAGAIGGLTFLGNQSGLVQPQTTAAPLPNAPEPASTRAAPAAVAPENR